MPRVITNAVSIRKSGHGNFQEDTMRTIKEIREQIDISRFNLNKDAGKYVWALAVYLFLELVAIAVDKYAGSNY